MKIAVIGGGAAGFFAAISARVHSAQSEISIFEGASQPLGKVRISGGGRCNVTHHQFDPKLLVVSYPRGSRELLGPFTRFGPRETVIWFMQQGVTLKVEEDGRMFPTTDDSATIVDALTRFARGQNISLSLNERLLAIVPDLESTRFSLQFASGRHEICDRLILTTGGTPQGHALAQALGHRIVPAVPSLFTFKISDSRIDGLSGVSFPYVEARLQIGSYYSPPQNGPMLVTHWGLSGPAILRLSAWEARPLHEAGYSAKLHINFVPRSNSQELRDLFGRYRQEYGRRKVGGDSPLPIPKRYWEKIVTASGIAESLLWSYLTRESLDRLIGELTAGEFAVTGKGIFKEEFVICGGVALDEIDFRTMGSRVCPGLYLAGEILDIDGITGGFNFQAAWTTGWLAGKGAAE